jgi:hypothetical protein
MTKTLKCESCGKRVPVGEATFHRWMNDQQFFCPDCKEDLDLEGDLNLA